MKRLKVQAVLWFFCVLLRVQGRVISPFNNDHSQSFANVNQGGHSNPYQIYSNPTIVHDSIHETNSFSLNKNMIDQNVAHIQPETFHDTYSYPINSWPAAIGGNRGKIMVEQTINFAPSIMPISENMAKNQNGMFLNPDFNIVASNSIGSGFNQNTFDQNVELGQELNEKGAKGVKVSNTADIFTNNNSIDQNIKFIQHVIPLESGPLASENTPDVVALSSEEESTSQDDVQGTLISDNTESDLIVSSISEEESSTKVNEKSNENKGLNDDDDVKDTLDIVGLNLDKNTELKENAEENTAHSSQTSLGESSSSSNTNVVESTSSSEKNLVESSSSSKTELDESSSSLEKNIVESSSVSTMISENDANQNTSESPLVPSEEGTISKNDTSIDNNINKGRSEESTNTSGRIDLNLNQNISSSIDIEATTEPNRAETDEPTNISGKINSVQDVDSGTTEPNSTETHSIETSNDLEDASENIKDQNVSDSASDTDSKPIEASSFDNDARKDADNDEGFSNDSKNLLDRVDGDKNQEDNVQDVTEGITEANIVQNDLIETSDSTESTIFENKTNQNNYNSTLINSANSEKEMPSKNDNNEEKTQGLFNENENEADVSNLNSNGRIQDNTTNNVKSSSSPKNLNESLNKSENILSENDATQNIEETKINNMHESNQQLIFSDGKIKLFIEKVKSTPAILSHSSNKNVNVQNESKDNSGVSINTMENTVTERISDGPAIDKDSTLQNEPKETTQIDTPESSYDEDTSLIGNVNQSNLLIEDTQTVKNINDNGEKSMNSNKILEDAATSEKESSDDIPPNQDKDIVSKNDAQESLGTDNTESLTTAKESSDDISVNQAKDIVSNNDDRETLGTDDTESLTIAKESSDDNSPNQGQDIVSNNDAQETLVTDDTESLTTAKESSDDTFSNSEKDIISKSDAQKTFATDDAEPNKINSSNFEEDSSKDKAEFSNVSSDPESNITNTSDAESEITDDNGNNNNSNIINESDSKQESSSENVMTGPNKEANVSNLVELSLEDDILQKKIEETFKTNNEQSESSDSSNKIPETSTINSEDDIKNKTEETLKSNNQQPESSSLNNIPETSTMNPDGQNIGKIEDVSSKEIVASQEANVMTPVVPLSSESKDEEEEAKLNDMYLSLSTLSNQNISGLKGKGNVKGNGLKKEEPENTINGININQPFQSVSIEPSAQINGLTLEEDKLKNLIDQQDVANIQNTESNKYVNEEKAQPAYIEKPLLNDAYIKEDKLKNTMDANTISEHMEDVQNTKTSKDVLEQENHLTHVEEPLYNDKLKNTMDTTVNTISQHMEDVQNTKTSKDVLEQENHLTHVEEPLNNGIVHKDEIVPKSDEVVVLKGNIINQNIAEKSIISHGINTDFTKSLNELSEDSIESTVNQNIDKENILFIDHGKSASSGPLHKDKTASNVIGANSKGNKISQNMAKGSFISQGIKTDIAKSTNKLGDASVENTVNQNMEETQVANSLVDIVEDNVKTEGHVQGSSTGLAHKSRVASNIGGVGSKHNTINQNILQGTSVSYGTHSDTAESSNKLGDDSLGNTVNQNVEIDNSLTMDVGENAIHNANIIKTIKSETAHKNRVASNVVGVGSKGNKINQNIAEGSLTSHGTKTDIKESSNELGKASVENIINQNIDKVESSKPLVSMDSPDVLYDDQVQSLPLGNIHEDNNIIEGSHISHAKNTNLEGSSNIVSDSLMKDISSYDVGMPNLITNLIQENHLPERHEQASSSGLVYKAKTSSNILGLNTKGNTVNQNIDEGLPSNGGIHTDISKSTNSIGEGSTGNLVNQNMNIMSGLNNGITENLEPFIKPLYTGSKLKIKESSNLLGINTEGNLVNQNIDEGVDFHNSGTSLSKSSNIIGEGSAGNTVNQNMNKGINIDTKVDLSGLATHSSHFVKQKYSGITQKIKKSSNKLGLNTKDNIVNQNIDEGSSFNHGILSDLSTSSNIIGDGSTGNTVNQNVKKFVNVDSRRNFMGHSIFQSNFMRPLNSIKKSSNILGLNTKRNIVNQNINEGLYLNRGTYTDISKSMNAIGEGSAANRVNQNINRVISGFKRHSIEKTSDSTPLVKRSYLGPIHKIKKSSNILGLNTKGNSVNQNIEDGSYANQGMQSDISKTMNEIGDGSVSNVVNQNINQHGMNDPMHSVKSSSNTLGLLTKRNTVNQNIDQQNHEVLAAPTYYNKPSQSGPLHKERVALNSVGLKASGNRINQNIIKGSSLHHGIETDISNSINTIDDGSTGNIVNQNIAEIEYFE